MIHETFLTLENALALLSLGLFLHIIYLPEEKIEKTIRRLWLPIEALRNHIHVQAGSGSGKSRLLGRIIAFFNCAVFGIPQVVIDPWGPTVDNLLDKLACLPRSYQEKLWPRIRYVDMSGRGDYTFPFPLYYRLGNESLYSVALRPLMVFRKLDPELQRAPMLGWNALRRVGTRAGMLLFTSGMQITEAEQLLENPLAFYRHFDRLQKEYPRLRRVIPFFRALPEDKERSRRIESFLNKLDPFSLDDSTIAMFGASTPGIDWQEVVRKRQTVLLDFRNELNLELRQFKMLWALHSLTEFVKFRGAGRHIPFGLIIDELAAMASVDALNAEMFTADFEELINVLGRNMGMWITVSHQELYQFSERLQKTLMSMGTQIIGKTSDPDAAAYLARNFFKFDPYWVKKYEPVWMSDMYRLPYVIDERSVEFTPEEQILLRSQKLMDLGLFQFLVRPALKEGDVRGKLTPVSIANYDRGQFPNESVVVMAREKLLRKYGIPVRKILSEIEAHQRLFGFTGQPLDFALPDSKEPEHANFWVG